MAIDGVAPGAGRALALSPDDQTNAERQQIKRLAQEFEAMLTTQMLREMRRSMLDDEDEQSGLGAGPLADTADVEFGRALSRMGGIGLTQGLLDTFERQVASRPESSSTSPAPAVPQEAARMSAAQDHPASLLPATSVTSPAPLSSGFGWRQDPVTGATRFHHGIDIAVAYGQEVRAAAGGTVAFAGTEHGYGRTIVVNHEGGRQTRYAHLSKELVRAGDQVAAGEVLGRSGNSGRSTGPHLHFELLVDGRPVDPVGAGE